MLSIKLLLLNCLICYLLLVVTICSAKKLPYFGLDDPSQFDKRATGGPMNVCNYLATNQDMNNIGLLGKCSNYCEQQFGRKPDSCQVNVPGDESGYHMCIIPYGNLVKYSGLTPEQNVKVLENEAFYEGNPKGGQKVWTESQTITQSLSMSTTNTVNFQETISYTVSAPPFFSSTFSTNFGFSSSKTQQESNTAQVTFSDQTTIQTDYGCTYTYSANTTQFTWSSQWSVPICLDGYARCQFGSPVAPVSNPKGTKHYYWYIPDFNFAPSLHDRCEYQQGDLGSMMVSSNSTSCVTTSCSSSDQCHFVYGTNSTSSVIQPNLLYNNNQKDDY